MKKIRYFIGFIALATLMASCASMSTMQTARTTDKGSFGWGLGGGLVSFDSGIKDTAGKKIEFSLPFTEVYTRYGITEKIDVGLKLTLIGSGLLDARYQFLGDKQSMFAGAAGIGAGRLTISSGDYKNTITDIHVPAYFSLHPNAWFSLYTSPRYIFRIVSVENAALNLNSSSNISMYGGTAGVRLGKKFGVLAEYSYMMGAGTPLTQITAGFTYKIDGRAESKRKELSEQIGTQLLEKSETKTQKKKVTEEQQQEANTAQDDNSIADGYYRKGNDIKGIDKDKAHEYWLLAAKNGHKGCKEWASKVASDYYRRGIAANKTDKDKAKEYWILSAKYGHEGCIKWMKDNNIQ